MIKVFLFYQRLARKEKLLLLLLAGSQALYEYYHSSAAGSTHRAGLWSRTETALSNPLKPWLRGKALSFH